MSKIGTMNMNKNTIRYSTSVIRFTSNPERLNCYSLSGTQFPNSNPDCMAPDIVKKLQIKGDCFHGDQCRSYRIKLENTVTKI